MEILYHGLRVFPAIVGSLRESGVYILCVRWEAVDNTCEIHTSNIPQLIEWAKLRLLKPVLTEHSDLYPWRVCYAVDGVGVFALLTEEDRNQYFPV